MPHKVLPPKKFGPTQRLQRSYAQGIREIIGRVLRPKLPEQTLEDWLQSLAERSQQADVQEVSMELARRMMQWTNVSNQRTWREAAARSMQSQKLYRLLQAEMQGATGQRVAEIVRDNARYISSLPLECARALTGEVTKAQEAGARAGTIAKMMKSRFPELLRSRVQFISRTEVAKASAALTQARCEALKIDFYEWETSLDARVRASHRKMQGILIPYNDPPSPEALNGEKSTLGNYHAGCAPNCRCPQIPLLSIDDVRWPHKVYSNGAIHMMTLVAFKERFMGVTA